MKLSFNLVDEAWIPVIDREGNPVEVGLREVFSGAHQLQCVAAENALETASILRLLLAVLHRTHDTSSRQAWAEIWQRGCFDLEALDAYWQSWCHRFDLFDPE